MVKDSDQVIALVEEGNTLPEFLSNSPKLTVWNVPDPKGKDLEFTRKVRDQIKDLIQTMDRSHE